MPTKVYQYGSPSNLIASGKAENQIRLQVRFWNQLVETDREFADRYREITNKADEKIASFNEQVQMKQQAIDALREEIKGSGDGQDRARSMSRRRERRSRRF